MLDAMKLEPEEKRRALRERVEYYLRAAEDLKLRVRKEVCWCRLYEGKRRIN